MYLYAYAHNINSVNVYFDEIWLKKPRQEGNS